MKKIILLTAILITSSAFAEELSNSVDSIMITDPTYNGEPILTNAAYMVCKLKGYEVADIVETSALPETGMQFWTTFSHLTFISKFGNENRNRSGQQIIHKLKCLRSK